MARRDPASKQTKERILEAALAVFGEQGYRGASIDEIAARAGATKGAVYYWFKDKDDLARDLQRAIWTRLRDEASRGLDLTQDIPTNLSRCFEAYLRALQRLGDARFFLRESWASPSLAAAAADERESAFTLLRELLRVGIDRGELLPLDPDAMARALVGAYAEATLHVLTTGDPQPTLDVITHLVSSLAIGKTKRKATST